ncbi:ATP-dependent RNA helicase dbp7, partial [Rhizopus stolonifer]
FEETLKKIMNLIDERTRLGCLPKYRDMMADKLWPQKRQTILCSATLRDDVKELAGWSLVNPAFISGTEAKKDAFKALDSKREEEEEEMKFSTPNQLKQTYTIIPAKLRLITLLALIKSYFFDKKQHKQLKSKVIVFFSCCDSVDFHYDLFSQAGKPIMDEDSDDETETKKKMTAKKRKNETDMMKKALDKVVGKNKTKFKQEKRDPNEPVSQISTLLGEKPVFRLHGELNQQTRSETFAEFSKATSVGEATLFLLPSEMEYLDILKAQDLFLEQITMETILKNIAEAKDDYQTPAQQLQNTMESYTVSNED